MRHSEGTLNSAALLLQFSDGPTRMSPFFDNNDHFPISTFVWGSPAVDLRRLCQGNGSIDISLEPSGIQQLRNFDQLFLIRLDDKEVRATLVYDSHQPAAGFENACGPVESLTSDCVKHHIDFPRPILKARRR